METTDTGLHVCNTMMAVLESTSCVLFNSAEYFTMFHEASNQLVCLTALVTHNQVQMFPYVLSCVYECFRNFDKFRAPYGLAIIIKHQQNTQTKGLPTHHF